jgi:ABC-type phosphate transport system permease subunit
MKDLWQISGAVVITVGALLIAIPAGLIVGGVFLVLIGLSLER